MGDRALQWQQGLNYTYFDPGVYIYWKIVPLPSGRGYHRTIPYLKEKIGNGKNE
jgi:hypothetical protein